MGCVAWDLLSGIRSLEFAFWNLPFGSYTFGVGFLEFASWNLSFWELTFWNFAFWGLAFWDSPFWNWLVGLGVLGCDFPFGTGAFGV